MQELFDEKNFFDWLRSVSRAYGNAMSEWGQHVHQAAARGTPDAVSALLAATDAAVDRLVGMLMAIGRRHDDSTTPEDGHLVLDALDRLIGASAELLREARAGLAQQGIAALASLSARIADLRTLEAEVESASQRLSGQVTDTFGRPE